MRLNEFKEQNVEEGYYDLNDDGMQPIDLSTNPSFKQLVNRYTQLYYQGHEGTYDDEESAESDAIEQYVEKRFGKKGSEHLMRAAQASYGGRDDGRGSGGYRSSNLGSASATVGNFRTTKAGKMHGQDAKIMKAKVADRLGRHPKPNLPEGSNPEYDDEAGMAHNSLKTMQRAVEGLSTVIQDNDNLPEWCQEKLSLAEDYLTTVWDYLISEKDTEQGVAEAGPYGSHNPDTMSPDNYDRYQQDQMDQGKRDFKRHEHEHEWEQEKAYSAKLAAQDRGPWYIRIDGKIYRQGGQPKVFDWKKGANNYALAMVKNNPSLQGKVMLTKSGEDK